MTTKQKYLLSITLMGLTVMLLGFQNCSAPGGSAFNTDDLLGSNGGVGSDGTPRVIIATDNQCQVPCSGSSCTFSYATPMYICILNVPSAAVSFRLSGATTGNGYTDTSWTYANSTWAKLFYGGNFVVGTTTFTVTSGSPIPTPASFTVQN